MYKSLEEAAIDLEKQGELIRIKSMVSGDLEMAEIHRRIFEKNGPAILFEHVEGSDFRALSNLYGTKERTNFLFRSTLDKVRKVTQLKADPSRFIKSPLKFMSAPFTALTALPKKSIWKPPSMFGQTTIDRLPRVKSWPMDGGAFITLPQVFTLPPSSKNIMDSNLGMYRIQLDGNEYELNKEIGLHYQIHRGIGIHHQQYNNSSESFKCSIFIGGPPSHAFSAIMPMPENISELTFAGMLAGRRFRYYVDDQGYYISSDADFVITGEIIKNKKKAEGPFGDHLGYYSLEHDFPIMKVDRVYHRKNPIWHFTVVGRPPAEDSSFGYLIHKLVEFLTPTEFPGLLNINAVDEAGVHPLLLAVAQDRYMPFREPEPEEIITIGNRILGSGQTSLAKFLWIAADDDGVGLDSNNESEFFDYVLRRIDWTRDLHFQTKTTIDTLDYSGTGWNKGSKVMVACRGKIRRELGVEVPFENTIEGVHHVAVIQPGILAVEMKKWRDYESAIHEVELFAEQIEDLDLKEYPLIILCDDARFVAQNTANFVWVTFTRSNPSHDIYGVDSEYKFKHWGCKGPLIIDARIKSHHAPELVPDEKVTKTVDKLFSKGGELYGI